ncbi:hypothetical protein HUA78_12420 [Myxococcus sp. CA033]|uniref:hypothetical protein n=1 Tax=Myxococcus sp. CA033 TaxID=2741516 RepID=UPI00157B5973|nr:hypothetical protein [Myxococcus sp. CA033]NTX35252.1 hypothetical protein [Myxococcus sp. CA033]
MHVASRRFALSLLLSASLFSGCSEDSQTPHEGPDTESKCPAVTGAVIEHQGIVSTSETWAAGSPHVITSNLTIRGQVTVEACATVRLAKATSIQVDSGGVLRAEGKQDQVVRFEPHADWPWGELLIGTGGSARLEWTVLSGGGLSSTMDSMVRVNAGAELPGPRPLFVSHVTIEDSRGPGIILNGTAGFAEGSSDLTIRGTGGEFGRQPLVINPNALGTLPSGTYTGNLEDAIHIGPSIAAASVFYLGSSATLKNLGVPYQVQGLQVGGPGASATLTIEAGTELRFEPGTTLRVYDGASALIVAGTPSSPVIFTSNLRNHRPGDWAGIRFDGMNAANRLESAVVRYAGGPCQCSSFGCNYLPPGFDVSSAILVFDEPTSPFIANSRIEDSAGHGILRGWNGSDLSLATSTTFARIAECTETVPKDRDGRCPSETPVCPRSP